MRLGIRRTFKILAPGNSLRKRVAYSLTIARVILVPVIFLAVYYLFEMGWIVDRIVNVDAPAATLAQRASIQMLETRRAERNYLLLHDQGSLTANRDSLGQTKQIVNQIQDLEPEDAGATGKALEALDVYEQRFGTARLPPCPNPDKLTRTAFAPWSARMKMTWTICFEVAS